MIEEWRDIEYYEGIYQVSNTGKVRSVDRKVVYSTGQVRVHKGRLLGLRENHRGYPQAMLSKNNRQHNKVVHRLVANAFIPNPENKEQVNHISGVKNDNNVTNLEWCTKEENELHAMENGLKPRGESHHKSTITIDTARYIKENPNNLSMINLAKELGLSRKCVCNIHHGHTWKHA